MGIKIIVTIPPKGGTTKGQKKIGILTGTKEENVITKISKEMLATNKAKEGIFLLRTPPPYLIIPTQFPPHPLPQPLEPRCQCLNP